MQEPKSSEATGSHSSSMARDGRYYEGQDLEALATLPAYQEWILEKFRPHLRGKVIEIGAGVGNIADRYADEVESLLLIEPAENLHARLKARFESREHVHTLCTLVERIDADARALPGAHGAPFDAALMVNVLEHVTDDASTLSCIRGILRPKGMLLLFVPALPWLYGTLDQKVGHERRYTSRGLSQLVKEAGFSVETIRYFDLPGIAPWFFLGRVSRTEKFSEGAAKLYDRLIVPVARAVEKYVMPPLGKNLLCIARAAGAGEAGEPRGAVNGSTS